MINISGLLLFLHYAWPCAYQKMCTGKITQEDYDKLKWLVENKMRPDIALIERCFPMAVREYRDTCAKLGAEIDFSFESVSEHWRHHHNHEGNCAVRVATVLSFVNGSAQVICDGKIFTVLDPFGFRFPEGTNVRIHHQVIIEEAE